MKIIGTTVLSISLFAGVSTVTSANNDSTQRVEQNFINVSPFAIDNNNTLTWTLSGNEVDPSNSFTVNIGFPNIKLYAKNTGSHDFRIEVKHNGKNKVIFNKTIKANGSGYEYVNNDSNPTVPSGTYTVTIYGGKGNPKGEVVLKSSDTKW